jgi:PAS domain S-box-containing protein
MNLTAAISLAGLVCYGILAYIVLRPGIRKTGTVHRLFLANIALMALWQCAALAVSLARRPQVALDWYLVMSIVVFGQFVVYSAFVQAFFGIRGRRRMIVLGVVLWGLSSLLLVTHRSYFLVDVVWSPTAHFYLPVFGSLSAILALPNYAFLFYAIWLLSRGYRAAGTHLERVRIRYLILGLAAVVLGSLANFVPLLKPYPIDQLGNICNALLIAYAIFRYQLLDMSVVIRKGLLYSIPTVTIGIAYFLMLSLAFALPSVALGHQFFLLSLLLAAVAALVLLPLRDVLQAAIDRLFFRERYDSGLMLQRLSRTAATVLDLDRLAVMILKDIAGTLHIGVLAFLIKEGETGQYVVRAQQGLAAELQGRFQLRQDHPVITWMRRHQTVVTRQRFDISPDFAGLWTSEREALKSVQAELFVPLLVRDDLIGILLLGPRLSDAPYSSADQLTLTTLANQTAVAVENARLFTLEQKKVQMTSTLLDVATAVNSTLNLDELLQLIAQRAAEVCGFDRCDILLVDRGQDTLRLLAAQYARAGGAAGQQQPAGPQLEQVEIGGLLRRAMDERRPIAVDRDAVTDLPVDWSAARDATGLLIVPLISKDRVIGLMALVRLAGERRIGEDQFDLAATIASQASVAIENARLYQETAAEKERTATIVERALAGIVLVDPGLKVVSMNAAVEEITGYSAFRAPGMRLEEVLGPAITAEDGSLKQAMATGKSVGPAETRLATPAGNRDVLLGVTPLSGGYLLSLADITPLKDLDRMKSDIIANVSHEFRTPLSIIKGYTEVLMDDLGSEDLAMQKEFLSAIDGAADRLTAIVRDLLDIARLEAGHGVVVTEPVYMESLIKGAVDMLSFHADQRKVAIDVVLAPDLPVVQGNDELLTTMLHNLLSNAVKFSDAGGTVLVQAGRQDGTFVLRVKNHGIGIPPEDMAHLFEKFYRSAEAKRAAVPGTGLGLVLIKHVVDQHKGTIDVASRPDTGTCFTVMLPIFAASDISSEADQGAGGPTAADDRRAERVAAATRR